MASKEIRKVVIRILPPEIDEEDLVSTFPNVRLRRQENAEGKQTSWIRFHHGKRYKGESKPSINARCYTSFDSCDLADKFMQVYHGHAFVDEKGAAFRAVCCYAPFQKIAKTPPKDKLSGTLESDPTYQKWLDKGDDLEHSEKEAEPTPEGDTPLLMHVRSTIQKRRREQKRKEKGWWGEVKKCCYNCGTKRRLEEDEEGRIWCRRCWGSWNVDGEDEDYSRDGSAAKDTASTGSRRERERERRARKREEIAAYDDYPEETEEVERVNCPRRHGLKKFIVDSVDWWCSVCCAQIAEGKKMFGCRKCDFDCCGKCYDASTSPSRRERRRRERREKEKKEKKRRKERRRDRSRERGSAPRWEPKKGDGVRVGELRDIDEEADDSDSKANRERERKRMKKRRRREESAAASFYASDHCQSCGSGRRLREASKDVYYCAKCWKWDAKEKWVKK